MLTIKILSCVALLLSIVIPFAYYAIGEKTRGRYKKALALNVIAFFGILVISQISLFSTTALAAGEAVSSGGIATGLGYIGAALATGLSGIGGGIAVANAASAALGAISEDSSVMGKSLIFVGLAEGVCLYGFIISFMIIGKL